jgi:hypothetical protein
MKRAFMFLLFPITLMSFSNFGKAEVTGLSQATNGWHGLVSKYVKKNGGVDYVGFAKDHEALKKFIGAYGAFDFKKATDQEKKAAYINLYNAVMIHHLLIHATKLKTPPTDPKFLKLEIDSLPDTPGGSIWGGDYKVKLGGIDVNLDHIEHDLIRGKASGKLAEIKVQKLDPRIHAAVNCAALSCPPVREKAYTPSNVEAMLEENIKTWLSSDDHFKKVGSSLKANKITSWYYSDFDDHAQEVLKLKGAGEYLATFIDPSTKDAAWKIKHLKNEFNDKSAFSLKLTSDFDFFYDWRVNDIRNK